MKSRLFFAGIALVANLAYGDELLRPSITSALEFVRVPAGCFQMGSDKWEKHEKPVHEACVDSFDIGKYEVTQGQWKEAMGSNPSHFSFCGDDCPVEQVSWNDAQEFLTKLNSKKQAVYRLPTEAEWEYACRSGGKDEEYAGKKDESEVPQIAWMADTSGKYTHGVGKKEPNGLGIHDMSGNVWEWVQDSFSTPYSSTLTKNNPKFEGADEKVLRGGSWAMKVHYVRCAIRNRQAPDHKDYRLGFRVVREVPKAAASQSPSQP